MMIPPVRETVDDVTGTAGGVDQFDPLLSGLSVFSLHTGLNPRVESVVFVLHM